MKKSISTILLAASIAALAWAVGGCEPEANAELIVQNDLGFPISELSLSGAAETGNLLDGAVISAGQTDFPVAKDVAPGVYMWHVVYESGPKTSDDGSEEFELFPGPNHLKLTMSPLP